MKKLLAIVISMAMVVAMMPMGVFAEVTEPCSSGECAHNIQVTTYGDTSTNTKHCTTLSEAVDITNTTTDANSTPKIVLLGNIDTDEIISITKDVIIDLNNFDIVGNDVRVFNVKSGKMQLTGVGTVTSKKVTNFRIDSSVIRVGADDGNGGNAELVIDKDVTIDAPNSYAVGTFGSTTTEILDVKGTIKTDSIKAAISGNGQKQYEGTTINIYDTAKIYAPKGAAIYHPQKGTLTISGGEIKGATGIQMCAGTLNITGNPKVTATEADQTMTENDGHIQDGAAVSLVNRAYPGGLPTANILGGTFVSEKAYAIKEYSFNNTAKTEDAWENAPRIVKGGTFSDLSALRYLAKTGDIDVNININKANSEFEAAGISIPGDINSNRNITIDLNGSKWIGTNSLTGSTGTQNQVLQLLKGNNVTIKNGTISIKEGQTYPKASRFIIQNYSNLTIEDVTLDGTNLADTIAAYTLSNNCGKVLLKGNTNIYAKEGQRAIDACWAPKNGYPEGTQVCINTTGEIRGTVEYDIWGANVETDTLTTLEIKSGVFNGNFYIGEALKDVAKEKITITGGTFSTDPSAYVASGYYVDKSGETWAVKPVPYTPSTPADNVTNNPADKNTTADLTPAVSDNKSTTTVDNATADKIVDKAVANKSTEVIVDATGNNTVASSEVAIPEKTVKELAEKTDANLVIKTDNGQVDLDRTALAAVAEQAGTTGTVRLVVETVKTDENICHVDLKLITSNGAVKDFNGGNVKVTINLDKELAAKDVVCVYINDNGIYTLVNGQKNADGTYTFITGHFSEYAVMAKADAEKKIDEQLNTLIKEVNLKVRTSKTSKKNIKAVVSGDVKALTDAGYTVKYKFYRSEKKASKYVGKVTKAGKTYINTAGKKGTKYYYKAKALVYQGDKLVGQTVLTQCKYGVRIWSK